MRPDLTAESDPPRFQFVEPGRVLTEGPMIPILLVVIALVLLVLAAIPFPVPKVSPGWLGLAFLAAAQLWELVMHFPGK